MKCLSFLGYFRSGGAILTPMEAYRSLSRNITLLLIAIILSAFSLRITYILWISASKTYLSNLVNRIYLINSLFCFIKLCVFGSLLIHLLFYFSFEDDTVTKSLCHSHMSLLKHSPGTANSSDNEASIRASIGCTICGIFSCFNSTDIIFRKNSTL